MKDKNIGKAMSGALLGNAAAMFVAFQAPQGYGFIVAALCNLLLAFLCQQ